MTGRLARLLAGAALLLAVPLAAQQLPPSTGGWAALDQGLRFLGHHKRVLMIGAHPDDEDSQFLTLLTRKLGAETAYLALTRGEGGQNLIGPELGDGLGVLRTEELLAARTLDGGRQFFTRAFDFGYSKGLPDTWAHWPRDSVLKDVVRIVRRFRPQVIVSVFSGTPRDGHGQHQAAGWSAREAFAAAGDAARFPELITEEGLIPWTPSKLYQVFRIDTTQATLTLDAGQIDPAVGQSYLQIAMQGRSRHRSQDMGTLQPIGPSSTRVTLVQDRTGRGSGGIFAGLDTTLGSLAVDASRAASLARLGASLRGLRPWDLTSLPRLRDEFERLLAEESGGRSWSPAASDQLRRMDELLFDASGMLCDALGEGEVILPGSTTTVTLSCWNASDRPLAFRGALTLLGSAVGEVGPVEVPPGELVTRTLQIPVPVDAPPTNPYFLTEPKAEGMSLYRWPAALRRIGGDPFAPPTLVADFQIRGHGAIRREVVYRHRDQAVGEVRRPITIVPRLAVDLSPEGGLWSAEGTTPHAFVVTVRMLSGDSSSGRVRLEAPDGWVVGEPAAFALDRHRAEARYHFSVVPPAGVAPGSYAIRAMAVDAAGRRYGQTVSRVEYPHTWPRQMVAEARATVTLGNVSAAGIGRVGYIRGAADRVPEVLRGLGVQLDLLIPDSLDSGGLSRYATIVVGPRAFETESSLAEFSSRLVEYARGGGTVIVQYQQQTFFSGGFAPYPISLTARAGEGPSFRTPAPRVADETAPVRVLEPTHPVFRTPNRIGPADWEGWVQERGLYFAKSWSDEWHPVLEMSDPGEAPEQGSLLIARVGSGVFVYTALSFFRELPAGVPGAARLFLNLLALDSTRLP